MNTSNPDDIRAIFEHAVTSGGRVRFYYARPGREPRWHESRITRVSGAYFYINGRDRRQITFRIDRVRNAQGSFPVESAPSRHIRYASRAPQRRPPARTTKQPDRSWFWWVSGVAAAIALFALFGASDETPSRTTTQTTTVSRSLYTTPTPTTFASRTTTSSTPAPTARPAATVPRTTASSTAASTQSVSFPPCVNSDCNCADFSSRTQLLAVFNSTAGDPHQLDGDDDGVPCEYGVGADAGSTTTTQPGQFIPYPGNGGGPTLCRDGTYSNSSGRGTCSWHGGIAR